MPDLLLFVLIYILEFGEHADVVLFSLQTTKIKAVELRKKTEPELQKQLCDLKTELSNLRLMGATRGGASKLKKIRSLRKTVARVYTVINQAVKQRQREAYRGKHYCPKDLRPKKTRAIRRRLKKSERKIHTVKTLKKMRAFPRKIYAVKA
ncbi:60S ribosomal protein L35 [Cichlidogyrus casuarinus]|uniref:Large ribosomal subunit protein uL29 n=1 Tax=Cichlidogyrus casuarinus TaxID=1844966 RepID=A0ABD2PVT6_9PLAT